MTPFAASPTYNMIYGKTLTYFPQAIVYLSVCLKVVMFMDVPATGSAAFGGQIWTSEAPGGMNRWTDR